MGANSLDVQPVAADHRLEHVVTGFALGNKQLGVAQVADTRREAKAQHVHQTEDVIGEACRVGVVFFDAQVGLVIQKPIEHVSRIAHADINHLGAERCVLVRNVGVEGAPWLGAVFWVDMTGALGPASSSKVLTVRRRRGAVTPVLSKGVPKLSIDQLGQCRRIGFVPDVPGLQPR